MYEAGLRAESEVEKLIDEYGRRAAAIVETLREIGKHADAINVASENRPLYSPLFAIRGLLLGGSVVLPSANDEYRYIWSRGEPEPNAAGAEAAPVAPFVPRSQPHAGEKFGGRTLPDGTRVFKMPPSDWGTPREYVNTETRSRDFEAN